MPGLGEADGTGAGDGERARGRAGELQQMIRKFGSMRQTIVTDHLRDDGSTYDH